MKKTICIISFSPIYRDGRVLRQIKYLAPHYDLTVIGYGHPHPAWKDYRNPINWIPLKPLVFSRTRAICEQIFLLLGRISWSFYDYWLFRTPPHNEALKHAIESRCDAFHANDWDTLPVAARAARQHQARLVFDAHEYGPLQYEHRRSWRLLRSPAINLVCKWSTSQHRLHP